MRPYFLLLACIFLASCGDDSTISNADNPTTSSIDLEKLEELENEWHTRCIDDYLPIIDIKYEQCLLAPGIYGLEGCENERDLRTQLLYNAWDWVLSTTKTEMGACLKDPRAYGEFCVSEYEFKLSFYTSMKCAGAVI